MKKIVANKYDYYDWLDSTYLNMYDMYLYFHKTIPINYIRELATIKLNTCLGREYVARIRAFDLLNQLKYCNDKDIKYICVYFIVAQQKINNKLSPDLKIEGADKFAIRKL